MVFFDALSTRQPLSVLRTMAALVEVPESEINDILNSDFGPEDEQEAPASLPLPTADFEYPTASQITSDWQLGPDLGLGFDLGNYGFGFQTIDPQLLDPADLPSEPFQLDSGAYRLPSKQTDRLVEQQPIQYRIEKLTEEDVFEANQNAPDPQSYIQMPEFLDPFAPDGMLNYNFEREVHARDWTRPVFAPAPNLQSLAVSSTGLADELAGCPIRPHPHALLGLPTTLTVLLFVAES